MGRDTIRIRDLANPVLTDLQRQAIASAPPVTMTEQAVLDAARKRTGLDDFGSEDFRDRLRVWLASFEEDSGLGPLGRATMFGEAVRYAASRLRVEDLMGFEVGQLIAADLGKGCGEFNFNGLMKLRTVKKPATSARKGRNPFTGEEIMIKAKPASRKVRVRALRTLNGMI